MRNHRHLVFARAAASWSEGGQGRHAWLHCAGNCQFRAVSDQLFRTPELYADVRRAVIHQLRSRAEVCPRAYAGVLRPDSKGSGWRPGWS